MSPRNHSAATFCLGLAILIVVGADGGVSAQSAVSTRGQPDGPIATTEPDWPQWRGPRRDGIAAETGLLQRWPEGGPQLLWKREKLGRGWSSPIIVDKRLYITGDVGDDLVIYAFDIDGRPLWQVTNGKSWNGPYPGSRAARTPRAGFIT